MTLEMNFSFDSESTVVYHSSPLQFVIGFGDIWGVGMDGRVVLGEGQFGS